MSKVVMAMKAIPDLRDAGIRIRVFLKDGSERHAHTTYVTNYNDGFSGIVIYDNKTRRAIQPGTLKGWWPEPPEERP